METMTQQRYARLAGLSYLLVLAVDIAGLVITSSIEGNGDFAAAARNVAASETLYRVGLCLALLGCLLTIPLAIGLFVTLRPANPSLATMGLVFRSAEAAIGGVGIVGSFAALGAYLAGSQTAFESQALGNASQVAAIFFSTDGRSSESIVATPRGMMRKMSPMVPRCWNALQRKRPRPATL